LLVDLQRAMIKASADDMNTNIEGLSAVLERMNDNMAEFQMPRNKLRPQKPPVGEENTSVAREPVGTAAPDNG
jgi:hypothetical protein